MKQKSSSTIDTTSEREVQMYLSSPVTPIKSDAIIIWEDLKSLFLKLSRTALQYLPTIATSVSSERLFSEAAATITQERSKLLEGTKNSNLIFKVLSINFYCIKIHQYHRYHEAERPT